MHTLLIYNQSLNHKLSKLLNNNLNIYELSFTVETFEYEMNFYKPDLVFLDIQTIEIITSNQSKELITDLETKSISFYTHFGNYRDLEHFSLLSKSNNTFNLSGSVRLKLLTDYKLSFREIQVLQLLVKGNSYKIISEQLVISLDTIKSHIKNIYSKLCINNKTEIFKILEKIGNS